MVIWGDFTSRLRKEEKQKQRPKGKLYLSERRVPRRERRGKKPFLSGQCKKIEENNRMRKTRNPFKQIRETKGIFDVETGTLMTEMVWT